MEVEKTVHVLICLGKRNREVSFNTTTDSSSLAVRNALESAVRVAFRDVISDHSSPEINLIFQVIRLFYLAHGLNFDVQMPIVCTVQEYNYKIII